jgi:molybdopterin molybdotransferase
LLSYSEALELILKQNLPNILETISLSEAQGRILAEDIYADRNYPPFNRAAMDGVAFNFSQWEPNQALQIIDTIFPGTLSNSTLSQGQCFRIMTGAALPPNADTIVKIEDCAIHHNQVIFQDPQHIKARQHIAHQGEDAQKNQRIIAKGLEITAPILAALASIGKNQVQVPKKPSIAIITTGNEVVAIDAIPQESQIRNSNQYALLGFCHQLGIQSTKHLHVHDSKEDISLAIQQCEGFDIIILTGGVSMGMADYVPDTLQSMGFNNIFHKVKIKPGKPLWFGRKNNTFAFALPGNPMSVLTTFHIFVKPFLHTFLGKTPTPTFKVPIATLRNQKTPLDEFFPFSIDQNGHAMPIAHHGSGDFISASHSIGIALHPAHITSIKAQDLISIYPW